MLKCELLFFSGKPENKKINMWSLTKQHTFVDKKSTFFKIILGVNTLAY